MNKEPIGLYILRILTALGLFFFMGMLYWSSLLVEEDLNKLNSQIADLKDTIQKKTFQAPTQNTASRNVKLQPVQLTSLADASLPNLLAPDPFYDKTLPKLLGPDFLPLGTFREDVIGRPNNLHPFSGWASINEWLGLCTISPGTSQFGKFESLAPFGAWKMELRTTPEGHPIYWIHLRKDAFWQPLQRDHFPSDMKLASQFLESHPVTAHDYKFFWEVVMNPYNQETGAVAQRTFLRDIEAVEVLDDYTLTVRWKAHPFKDADGKETFRIKYTSKMITAAMLRPLPSFVFKYFADGKKIIEDDSDPGTYRNNTVFAQNFSQHWAKNVLISCGPWLFDGMSDRQIAFKRNPDFFEPLGALAEGIINRFKDNFESQWQNFKILETDFYKLQPDQLIEWENFKNSEEYRKQAEQGKGIQRLDYMGLRYYYIGWNQARPLFTSRKVRQALTMAIDRKRIIQQNLNGLGVEITGTFSPSAASFTDPSIQAWPFDPLRAKRLLEEEGWYDHNGDGIIDKEINGKRVDFRFTLTYYVKNALGKAISEYIATSFKEIGILCELNGVDIADLTTAFEDKNFDGIYLGWSFGAPPEDPRQIWHSSGATEKGSSNAIGFVNPEADAIIDKLEFEDSPEKRRELYYRFDQIIHEEQPYTFLFAPKEIFLYRDYVQNVFIPAQRQDLVPGADVPIPISSAFWLKQGN